MSDEDEESKTFDPTPQKLRKARDQGDIPRSADLTTAAAYGGFVLASASAGVAMMGGLSGGMQSILAQSGQWADLVFRGGAAHAGTAIGRVVGPLAPWFAIPTLAALLAVLGQRALVLAPSKLQPKLSRISPMSNARNRFGLSGLFEFAKSGAKLVLHSILLTLFLSVNLDQLLGLAAVPARAGLAILFRLTLEYLVWATLLALSVGGVDYAWQYFDHQRRNRMSLKELRDEVKENEGDPALKSQRRQKGIAIATNQMLADVAQATVVVVNPTHYAVALNWDAAKSSAPKCVAKGVDEIAARIRERAAEHGVPIHSDPATARALFATVEIGQTIPPQHYRAVAAAIRFAEALKKKRKP